MMINSLLALGIGAALLSSAGLAVVSLLARELVQLERGAQWWRMVIRVVIATAFAAGPLLLYASNSRSADGFTTLSWLALVVSTVAGASFSRSKEALPLSCAWAPGVALVISCLWSTGVETGRTIGVIPSVVGATLTLLGVALASICTSSTTAQNPLIAWRSLLVLCAGALLAVGSTCIYASAYPDMAQWQISLAAVVPAAAAIGCIYLAALLLAHGVREIRQETADLSAALSRASEDIFDLEQRDPVTLLQSRDSFHSALERTLGLAADRRALLAIMVVNIDGIGVINDSYGIGSGDDVLRTVAGRILSRLPDGNASRLDGKEFALLMENFRDVEELCAQSAEILDTLSAPVIVDEEQVLLNISAGVAIFPIDGEGALLVKRARQAMQRARKSGRRQLCLFDASLDRSAAHNPGMEARLHRALANSEFVLYLQPKCEPVDGRIVGAEALLRWECKDQAPTGPAEFIPIAERCGLIKDIGWFVIEEACRLLGEMREGGITLPVSVNLSPAQFADPDLLSKLCKTLAEHSISPGSLCLEVTEGMAIDNPEQMRIVLAAMRGLGFRVAMDDFGTGYSSLSKLVSLPVDELKIDRSFITNIEWDARSRSIVEAVVRLGRACGCIVVVEGVETQNQARLVREFGVDQVQGFYWHRPMPFANFLQAAKADLAKNAPSKTRGLALIAGGLAG